MKTVKQVCEMTGVSVRALHHYDAIGLLPPTAVTEAGYRLYDDGALNRLQLILVFRELGFPLKDIKTLLEMDDAERSEALQQQIRLLEEKRSKLQSRISLAALVKLTGVKNMNFENFDARSMDDYDSQAKTLWGKTEAYREYQTKSKGRSRETDKALGDDLMGLFRELGTMKALPPSDPAVQQWVARLQGFITEHYYTCTRQILFGLGQMYADGGSMTENIDRAGGPGTGAFAKEAIELYCKSE